MYLLSYSLLQVDTPTANQLLCYFKILEDLLLHEEGEVNVDGLILLNQSRAIVPFAYDQDDGRGRGALIEEYRFSLNDVQESRRIQHRR